MSIRTAYFDLETHDLSPEFGPVMVASVLSLPGRGMVTFRQDEYVSQGKAQDMADDEELLLDLRDFLNEHDILVAYYGKNFDCTVINSRLIKRGHEKLEPNRWIDPYYAFGGWGNPKPKSRSLEDVARYIGMDEEKKGIPPDIWVEARAGRKKAMDEAVERCESDVRLLKGVTEEALDRNLIKHIQMWP